MNILKRAVYRFSSHQKMLKNLQLTGEIDFSKAQVFIANFKRYMPYSQTITSINKLMSDAESSLDKQYLRALVEWKYTLADVVPVCERIVGKEGVGVGEEEMEFLAMMIITYPNQKEVLERFVGYLGERLEKGTLVIKDARRIRLANRISPELVSELSDKIMQRLIQTNDPQQLSELLLAMTVRNFVDPWTEKQNQLKLQIGYKMCKELVKNMLTLTQKQTGQMLGNLILSTNINQQSVLLFPRLSKTPLNSQQDFLRYLKLIQQYIVLYANNIKTPDMTLLNKIFQILEIKKQPFNENQRVGSALEENRYFIESVIQEARENPIHARPQH